MQTRRLGPFTVSAIGLGAMPVSMTDKPGPLPEEADAIKVVHAALDAGVTFIDTADIYAPSWDSMGHNERIVGKALKAYGSTDGIVVGMKGGITRSEGEGWGRDGSIEYLRKAVEASLRALQVDVIDLYQWHRPDRWMVYGDVIANFKTLQDEGKIRAIGISNANVEEIEVAVQVLGEGGLASVQNEFSPGHAGSYDEVQYTGEHGIAFLPWSPLGGTGGGATKVGQRFGVLQEVADAHGVSPQQVVLAWELSLGDHVIAIPGASRPQSITDSAKAGDLVLTAEETRRISVAVGVAEA
jgi:aryl-alcohol dehydrogenase-like predicted oxidoreductase